MMMNNRKYVDSAKLRSWKFYTVSAIGLHLVIGLMFLIGTRSSTQHEAPALIHAVITPLAQSSTEKPKVNEDVQKPAPQPAVDTMQAPELSVPEPPIKPEIAETTPLPTTTIAQPARVPMPKPQQKPLPKKPIEVKNPDKTLKQADSSHKKDSKIAESTPAQANVAAQHAEKTQPNESSLNRKEIDRYRAMIAKTISRYWIVPANLDKNLTTLILLRLAPGGIVLDAQIIQASGEPMLDRSALAAVNKASPLPVPEDGALFDQFRELRVKVRPEGIVYDV